MLSDTSGPYDNYADEASFMDWLLTASSAGYVPRSGPLRQHPKASVSSSTQRKKLLNSKLSGYAAQIGRPYEPIKKGLI